MRRSRRTRRNVSPSRARELAPYSANKRRTIAPSPNAVILKRAFQPTGRRQPSAVKNEKKHRLSHSAKAISTFIVIETVSESDLRIQSAGLLWEEKAIGVS